MVASHASSADSGPWAACLGLKVRVSLPIKRNSNPAQGWQKDGTSQANEAARAAPCCYYYSELPHITESKRVIKIKLQISNE